MEGVTVVRHPLVQHKLTLLRDKSRSTKSFRELCHELGILMCYEVTRDLPLDLALSALLEANGYYFEQQGDLLRVRNRESRLFQIDYIRGVRSSQGSNAVQISSGSVTRPSSEILSRQITMFFVASVPG